MRADEDFESGFFEEEESKGGRGQDKRIFGGRINLLLLKENVAKGLIKKYG